MLDDLYRIIKENEEKGDFTYANVSDGILDEAEKKLDLKIPSEYRWFLKNFGHGGIGGLEVLGIGKNGRMVFVEATLRYRSYGLPKNVIMIENCDEWVYCIDSSTGKIGKWSQGEKKCTDRFESFEAYLQDSINDVLENSD